MMFEELFNNSCFISDVFTSRVSFRIVNKKFKDDLLDPSSESYSELQIQIQRNVSRFVNFLLKQLQEIQNPQD